jgi:hypothetical protein
VGVAKGAPQQAVLIALPHPDRNPHLAGAKAPGRQQNLHILGYSAATLTRHLNHCPEEAPSDFGASDNLQISRSEAGGPELL